MAFAVFYEESDAALIEAALRDTDSAVAQDYAEAFAARSVMGFSPCADQNVASPSFRIELEGEPEDLAAILDGEGYLGTLAQDVRECSERL